jgi:uncharacterized protein with HEPN domain
MSARRDWRLLVQDIIEYGSDLSVITAGMDYDTFLSNRVAQLAVSRCLEIMGEAARHVPPEVQARCPEVEWRLMNDMRNVLIHAYTTIDTRIVWNAATIEAPRTLDRLVRLLENEGASDL